MKKSKFRPVIFLLLLVGLMAVPATALAHPLGNFTINHYSRVEIGAAGVELYYILDIAEIPTFQERDVIDLNRDGQISESEQKAYLDRKLAELQPNLKLAVNGSPTQLKLVGKSLDFLPGQGGLQTTRLTARFETSALAKDASNLTYQDDNYADRLGWREIVVRNATGVALEQSSAPATDQSDELRNYPQDMLSSPLAMTSARASFKLDPSVIVQKSSLTGNNEIVKTQDPFAALVSGQELTLPVILFAFGTAVVLGMFHALSPGHGKTIVAAYLVGSRGTARHALFLGLTVTITHTIGVFVLGLITLLASQFILPEKLYPWLGLTSGLLVLVMGLTLFRNRLRLAFAGSGPQHSHHDHGHDHSHDHSHELVEAHSHNHSLQLVHAHDNGNAQSHHEHEHHEQGHSHETHEHHDHDHVHAEHDHSHDHDHSHNHDHAHDHDHSHVHTDHEQGHSHDHDHPIATTDHHFLAHSHSHGGKVHSHLPPGADGSAVTWRRLLIFGISAGLLPCPSALVVMLSAIALNRTVFGLVLIIFFSLGLAGTLTGIGMLLVYARRLMTSFKPGRAQPLIRLLPVASAFVVTILGLAISYEALLQTGILNR